MSHGIGFARQRGYTLLEVVVVLGILTILLSMSLSSLARGRQRAEDHCRQYQDLLQAGLANTVTSTAPGLPPAAHSSAWTIWKSGPVTR
jgi:prepilin-type N-terminal cleavage/methylation domain-containing protein